MDLHVHCRCSTTSRETTRLFGAVLVPHITNTGGPIFEMDSSSLGTYAACYGKRFAQQGLRGGFSSQSGFGLSIFLIKNNNNKISLDILLLFPTFFSSLLI